MSHLLEHMAFKGTSRRTARDIAEAIEAVGGEMNAETSVDHTTYYLRLLKERPGARPRRARRHHQQIRCSIPDELALEQHVILQEIGAAHDVPEDWVFELFQQAAFPDQAIGRTVLGTPESIRAHTSERPEAVSRRRIIAGRRSSLAAAGNVDARRTGAASPKSISGELARPSSRRRPSLAATRAGGRRKSAA